jgi:hypothetical protein
MRRRTGSGILQQPVFPTQITVYDSLKTLGREFAISPFSPRLPK